MTTAQEIRERFSKNLVAIREIHGLTKQQAAEQMGISYPYLCQLEAGTIEKNVSNDVLEKIVNFYEIEVYMLYK